LGEVPIAEIPTRLKQFVDEAREHAAEPVRPSNDGADIEAVIGASRDKLRVLDVRGARDVLQAKIIDEEQARLQRLVPLLKERAWVERLAFDYDAAESTLHELTALAPDDVWTWIDLGDLWRLTGSPEDAAIAYHGAESAGRRIDAERDLSVSQERIGDVLVAHGDRDGALKAYEAGLAIRETLTRRDPANTEWQRDLIVSCMKISENDPAEARRRLSQALEIARGLQATGRLAPVDNWMADDLARRLADAK